MKILSIESSCDETSAAVVEDGRNVLSNIISSQIDIHTKFGGVVPEVASRKHIENISIVVKEALKESGCTFEDIDAIAVTYGPGLVGALLVGLQYAKGLAYSLDKPLIAVNHTEGHISANYIEHKELEPPFVTLVVSGGNTFIAYVKDYGEYEILGQTRDDAAGEAFDKVARSIGLGYPGGPKVDKVSKEGNEDFIKFPKANFHDDKVLDFSFSGVKSAVLNYINNLKMKGETYKVEDVAASFQKSVVEVLVDNGIKACKNKKNYTIAVAGGVGCNTKLRTALKEQGEKAGIKVLFPSPVLCTDNAAMIGAAAYYQYMKVGATSLEVNATPNLKLGERRY